MSLERTAPSQEHERTTMPGWTMLPVTLLLVISSPPLFLFSVVSGMQLYRHPIWHLFIAAIVMFITGLITLSGFFTLQPNEARVLLLFGEYRGTVRRSGFHWGNPFYSNGLKANVVRQDDQVRIKVGPARHKVSLRARTLMVDKLKVNEKQGNPIEIAAVVVWRVENTAQATFDVDDYERYVHTQSEAALRHLASSYSYDNGEANEPTLRGNVDDVSHALRAELQDRLSKAGVVVDEARLTNLSYAPEIAQAMLRRQQAEAVIAARQKIVHGAVSMVDMALRELAAKDIVDLDDGRKAAMVSNLMVVLCGEAEVHPVVNTGTLYT